MWKWLVVTAREWSLLSMVLRMSAAMIVGLAVGIDRGLKRRGAGIKTHVLVCLGAAVVMMTGQYMSVHFPSESDLGRLGAQVISGVGFLGVGTIIVTGKNQIRGLTTAAGLWTCACLGLAAGIGYMEGVVLGTAFALFTFKILNYVDHLLPRYAKVYDLYLEFERNQSIRGFRDALRSEELKLVMFEVSKSRIKGEGPTAIATIEVKDKSRRAVVMDVLREIDGVRYVEEL
ncbi:MAG: MgtC/SapB family protein [Lachnospiraceae bacterium]|nr:MgtC/SapB family protein [Lachnospiraceae bacterium]